LRGGGGRGRAGGGRGLAVEGKGLRGRLRVPLGTPRSSGDREASDVQVEGKLPSVSQAPEGEGPAAKPR
jgi:hypothetical protein